MGSQFVPKINPLKCFGCELCVKECPNQALAMRDQLAVVSNPAACDYSAICQEICPSQAISLPYVIICSQEDDDMPHVT